MKQCCLLADDRIEMDAHVYNSTHFIGIKCFVWINIWLLWIYPGLSTQKSHILIMHATNSSSCVANCVVLALPFLQEATILLPTQQTWLSSWVQRPRNQFMAPLSRIKNANPTNQRFNVCDLQIAQLTILCDTSCRKIYNKKSRNGWSVLERTQEFITLWRTKSIKVNFTGILTDLELPRRSKSATSAPHPRQVCEIVFARNKAALNDTFYSSSHNFDSHLNQPTALSLFWLY